MIALRSATLAVLLACASPLASARADGPTIGERELTGRVLDLSGASVPAAVVTVEGAGGGRSVRAGADGSFRIAVRGGAPHRVTATAPGFGEATVEVGPDANGPVHLVLGPARLAESVEVGGRVDLPSGKLALPVRDLVQTVEVVPHTVLEERAVVRINEGLETAIGVQPISGYGGMDSAGAISRGFANDWVLRNGFRLFRFGVPLDPVIVERLEILKGPASLLAGQTDPGGTLNLVSKAPLSARLVDFRAMVGSDGLVRNTLDAGGALPGSDGRVLTRITLAQESAGSHRDTIDQHKLFMAPQLAWQIGPRTRLDVELDYFRYDFDFERGLPPDPLVLQVPVSRVLADPRLPRSESRNWSVFQQLTQGIGQGTWKVRQGFAAMSNENRIQETYLGTPDASGVLDLFLDRSEEENRSIAGQLELGGEWRLAGRRQRSVVGLEYSHYLFGYTFFDVDGTFSPFATVDLFSPSHDYALPERETPVFGDDYGSDAFSVYFDHQAELGPKVKLLAGGRFDRTDGFYFNRLTGTDHYPDQQESRFSPRVGAVYTPLARTDVYASYATSFKPNVFGTDPEGRAYEPETGDQFELGVRHEIVPGRFRGHVAAYRITKENVVVFEPPDFASSSAGTRRSEGVEVEATGSPWPGLSLTAGYALCEAEITADTDPTNVGARLFGVPRHQANLWSRYEVQRGAVRGLTVGYGLFYLGERAANEPSTLDLPESLRHDLMASYRRGRVEAQVNVANLTGERIYDTHGFFVYPRAGTTVRGSINVVF